MLSKVFLIKKINQNEVVRNDSCFEKVTKYKAENLKEIENFEKLFENSEYTGYCCCPETNFAIYVYDESESFEKPDWLGQEVTNDEKYYNAYLSKNPYKNW